MVWDPAIYHRYATERGRPFFDLVSQVAAPAPTRVVDLGCGTGELTATLRQRWPQADVLGIDSSAEMLAASAPCATEGVRFVHGQAQDFDASGLDVLISNALLQWVPDHSQLLARWAAQLNSDGWLAFQVPANFGSPSHTLMREVAESPRWQPILGGILRHDDAVASPGRYLDLLTAAGFTVSAWQTEYLHILPGNDPVLDWVRGTGLRPVLDVLTDDEQAEFLNDYGARLRQCYPRKDYGTVFAFNRIFVLGHKA